MRPNEPPPCALEFQDIFRIDSNDDSDLDDNDWLTGGDDPIGDIIHKIVSDAMYKAVDAADVPIEIVNLFKVDDDTDGERASVNDISWDEIIGERVEKTAGPLLPATGTLAKRLGIVRTEQVLIDCQKAQCFLQGSTCPGAQASPVPNIHRRTNKNRAR